jgi:hypothetical protein
MGARMQQIEIDPDHYDRIALIAKAIDWQVAEVLIAILDICDEIPMPYAEFANTMHAWK